MIAFDAISAVGAATGTSLTFAHTTSGTDRFLIVCGSDRTLNPSAVTGVTYAGVAMTKAVEQAGNVGQNDRAITIWYLANPASGANNVVVSIGTSQSLRFSAVSYTGVDQSSPLDGTDTAPAGSASTSVSTDITTTVDNCWMFMFCKDDNGGRTYTSTTGDTVRRNADAGGHAIIDTGGAITPAGLNTMTVTLLSSNVGGIAIAFKPVSAATASTSGLLLRGYG